MIVLALVPVDTCGVTSLPRTPAMGHLPVSFGFQIKNTGIENAAAGGDGLDGLAGDLGAVTFVDEPSQKMADLGLIGVGAGGADDLLAVGRAARIGVIDRDADMVDPGRRRAGAVVVDAERQPEVCRVDV